MILAGVLASLTFFSAEHDLGGAVVQGLSVTIIGFTVFSAIAVRRTNRALVAARHELARLAVADERSRIARDLHDTLGHSLSVIALKSELAGRLVDDDPARAKAEMADVERVARESLSAVRETIGGYRQPTLAAELAGARSALAAAGIDGRVEPAPEGIPAPVDAVLGWAVREGVTNIVRHARAGSAEIRVELSEAAAGVDIRNDGSRAGAAADDASATPRRAGTGLAGLRERVAIFGGVVEAGPVGRWRLPAPRLGAHRVIRILIAEDQSLVRGAIVALLGLEPDLEVVADVARGDEVVPTALEVRPDVALLDIEMPGLDGLSAAAQLRTALPSCRTIVVTTFGRPGYLRRAMEAGASGFLLKDAPAAQLAEAIRRVAAGGRVVDPALALDALAEGTNPLVAPRARGPRRVHRDGHDRRARHAVVPVGGHGPQPPLGGHPEGWRAEPGGGRADRRGEGLARPRRGALTRRPAAGLIGRACYRCRRSSSASSALPAPRRAHI